MYPDSCLKMLRFLSNYKCTTWQSSYVFSDCSFLLFQFQTLWQSVEALFCTLNGDDLYVTFTDSDSTYLSAITEIFSKLYLALFVFIFIYAVLSLFIGIFTHAYDSLSVSVL